MADPLPTWTSDLPWAPHQAGLAAWAARRWAWDPSQGDWPSALALLAAAEDEGHTALAWDRAPEVWDRRWASAEAPPPWPGLPAPDLWPADLWEGWLVRKEGGLVQTRRHRDRESALHDALAARLGGTEAFGPGEGQEAALARAGLVRLLVLAGGPGTGKTHTLRGLVKAWAQIRPSLRVAVAAPTGRAAARAQESFAGLDPAPVCQTLHRLLGLRPGLAEPVHGPDRPLAYDLVIVDEASMLDLRTAGALVGALAPDTALVLVGDPGQLPSVEAGSLLADLLRLPVFAPAVVRLTHRFRLAETSRTLAGLFDLLQDPNFDPALAVDRMAAWGAGDRPDFRWIEVDEGTDPGPAAVAAWQEARGRGGLTERILLSPVHQGPGGVEDLGRLAERVQGRNPGTVAPGLPWMITRNLPHLELNNGDRGLVEREGDRLWFALPGPGGVRRPFGLVAEDGTPAWAITVHKSQGSEFGTVVLALPPGNQPGLVRELVYTALTRARDRAVLVASRQALAAALGRRVERWSGFGVRESTRSG